MSQSCVGHHVETERNRDIGLVGRVPETVGEPAVNTTSWPSAIGIMSLLQR